MKSKDERKEKNKNEGGSWFIVVFFITFILSTIFSYVSTNGISNIPVAPALVILFIVILYISFNPTTINIIVIVIINFRFIRFSFFEL